MVRVSRRYQRPEVKLRAVALLGLLAVSCGSTAVSNPNALTSTAGDLSTDAGALEVDGMISPVETAPRAPGGGSTRSSSAQPAGSSAPVGAIGDGTKEVKVGVYYVSDANQALAAVGAESTAPDPRAAADILVKDINARGGVAGRRLVPVYHGVRTQGADREVEDQGACADFTSDRRVMAVINPGYASRILADCLAKAGIVYLYSGLTIDNADSFRKQPLKSAPISMSLDRVARVEPDRLAAQGYLRHAPGSSAAVQGLPVKLGVIALDLPDFRDVYTRVLAPAYKAKGVPVSEVRFVRPDTAGLSADIDSAVLAFSQRNVTHVTFLTAAGLPPGLFVVRAHTQGYRPRYGFSSQDAMQIVWQDNIRQIFGDSAATQFRGAVGVGWMPLGDVANPTQPGTAPDSYQRCIDVMRKGGLGPRDTNYNLLLAYVCDGIWFADAAFEAGGTSRLSPSSFVSGENSLGGSFAPATVSSTRMSPDRHDGVGSIRNFAFFDQCKCFRYTSERTNV